MLFDHLAEKLEELPSSTKSKTHADPFMHLQTQSQEDLYALLSMDDRFKGLLQCYSAFRDILLTVNDDVLDSMLADMHRLREKVDIIEDTQKLQRHAMEKSQRRQAKQVHKMDSGIRIEGPKETQ